MNIGERVVLLAETRGVPKGTYGYYAGDVRDSGYLVPLVVLCSSLDDMSLEDRKFELKRPDLENMYQCVKPWRNGVTSESDILQRINDLQERISKDEFELNTCLIARKEFFND